MRSTQLEAIVSDITQVDADVIVNAANNDLWMGAGVAGGGYFLGTLLAAEQLKDYGLRPLYAAGLVIMAALVCMALVLPVGLHLVFALTAGISLVAAITAVCLNALLASETSAGRATTMGANTAIFSLGSAAGVAVGGALIALGGYPTLGLGLSSLLIISTFLVWQPRMATRVAAAGPDR